MKPQMPTLHDSVQLLPGIGPKKADELASAEIFTLGDLLQHIPFRYEDASQVIPFAKLAEHQGELVTLEAEVHKVSSFRTRSRLPITQVTLVDQDGDTLKITYFRQNYVSQNLKEGESYAFTGKVGAYKGTPTLTNPHFEPLEKQNRVHTGKVLPIYPQRGTLSTVWFRRITPILVQQTNLLPEEYLPPRLLEEAHLPERNLAWKNIHLPETINDAYIARRRIAFDELWEIFDGLAQEAEILKQIPAKHTVSQKQIDAFRQRFEHALPYTLTETQSQALDAIGTRLMLGHPIRHFVQGEVGSGKTFVAAYALFLIAATGGHAVYLVPTTVLAEQHFATLQPLAEKLGITISLWTGNQKQTPHADILVGTHALLHKTYEKHPDMLVVDEEHRFGVSQREQTWDIDTPPHRITMTATPIPRTLARIIYGTDEISFLEPIPGKERSITTRVFPATKLSDHFAWLSREIKEQKTQAFVITPLIETSDAEMFSDVYDAESVYQRLKKEQPSLKIAQLTGKTPAAKKQHILNEMKNGDIDVLVATPVIEVGIDIPQAGIITILSAERFGFAQLHQLRGRVGRSGQNGWCFLVPSPGKSSPRLKVLETLQNGHELAEIDLQNRGAGEFLGTQQTGWNGLKIATWMDMNLIELVKDLHSQQKPGTIQVQPIGSEKKKQ